MKPTASIKITAHLTIKGHSERVPNKNMRIFTDRFLYHRVASILEKSSFVNAILIDTDREAITLEAPKLFYKVKIINRLAELRGDMVPMNAITVQDIAQCEN